MLVCEYQKIYKEKLILCFENFDFDDDNFIIIHRTEASLIK